MSTRAAWPPNQAGRSTPQADGTLKVISGGSNRDDVLIAYRPEVARAKGFPQPSNLAETDESPRKEHGEQWALDFGDGARASVVACDSG